LRRTQMFVRAQARFLAGELPDLPEWLDFEQAARFLGCSQTLITELTKGETLPAQLSPLSPQQINRSALMDFVAGLRRCSPDLPPRACDTSIAEAVSNLQAVGLGTHALLQRVMSSQLPFWLCHRGHLLFLQDSLFDGHALTRWIADVKSEHRWLSICEVAHEVHTSPDCVMTWIEAGVITLKAVFGHDEYLDPSIIKRLTVDLLHDRSTKNWLGIPFRTLQKWIDRQWITPVFVDQRGRIDRFLFNRLDVEQLFSRVYQTRQLLVNAKISARWIDDAIEHARIKLLPFEPFDQLPRTLDSVVSGSYISR